MSTLKRRPADDGDGMGYKRARREEDNEKAARVFEAMTTWHMGADRRQETNTECERDCFQGGKTKETLTHHDRSAAGHDRSLFADLRNLAATNRQSHEIFTARRAGLLDASQSAVAKKHTWEDGHVEYTNQLDWDDVDARWRARNFIPEPKNARSRRMMAAMEARDEAAGLVSNFDRKTYAKEGATVARVAEPKKGDI